MNLAHEVVEMHPALAHQRHAAVERVHQEALAAPHRPPQVDALGKRRLDDQALQRVGAPRLVVAPFLVEPLQPLDGAPLRGIGDEAALLQVLSIEGDDILAHPLSDLLSTASAASRITSDIEGCAWQMRAMSSAEAPNSMATTASAISSLARLPIACTPRMRSVRASARILMNPSPSSRLSARPL